MEPVSSKNYLIAIFKKLIINDIIIFLRIQFIKKITFEELNISYFDQNKSYK